MDGQGSSRTHEANLVLAPKDYFLGPVFAATKQAGPREVIIGGRRYQIGGSNPMRRDCQKPALDVRHARAIFALLSFRDPFAESRLIRFSFNEFCRRYARTNGGRYARAISGIVADLIESYISVTDLKTGIGHQYRLIERLDVESRPPRRRDSKLAQSSQSELWFNGCSLSPEFFGLLGRITELQHLRLDVFTSIRSPLAQAIYLYIPSRAHHHDERSPFEITVSKLLEQISAPIPPHKSKRKELFTKHQDKGRAIIQQLDGRKTLSGVFRVRLAETCDKSDWKIQAWIEKPEKKQTRRSNSILVGAWLESGRSRESLDQRLASLEPLTGYEMDLLEAGGIRLAGSERFFELAKAMLWPSRFVGLLAEAKGDQLEGRKARKNPTARLIWRIREAIAEPQNSSVPNPPLFGQQGQKQTA
jgi:hypothetical protein